MLAPSDQKVLDGLGLVYEVVVEHGLICVVIKDWPLPPGYQTEEADLLLRLPPGFPDAQPDMWWMDPPVARSSGSYPEAANLFEVYLGRNWQRFSRHLNPGAWQPGRDSLASYLALIRADLNRGAA
jgi:hypothetical protein